jgi:repressor of nif and glnA expression
MIDALKAGLCISNLVVTAQEGERPGSMLVPSGEIGFATVCSATVSGVPLKASIPLSSGLGECSKSETTK